MPDNRGPEQRNREESHLAGPAAPFMYGFGYDIAVRLNEPTEAPERPPLFTRKELLAKINGLGLIDRVAIQSDLELVGTLGS
jgi:hypothetical protein